MKTSDQKPLENITILERVINKTPGRQRTNGMNDSMRLPEAYANRPQSAYTTKKILGDILPALFIVFMASTVLAQGVRTSDPSFSAPWLLDEKTTHCEEVRENTWGLAKVTCYGTPFIADYAEGGHLCASNVYRILFVMEKDNWFRYEHALKDQPITWEAEHCQEPGSDEPINPNY